MYLRQYRTKGVSPESREIFVWNKDKSTGIAALFRAFWTPFPRKKIREDGAHDLCGVALDLSDTAGREVQPVRQRSELIGDY